ncbi:MAG: calcium-binding protein [Oscillatoriales cyanobacterium RM2_1_1]|nr:calcium-binding protein [Oscillatoriales cyanobacterium SM2_3_0]NJO47939.1 calcium-binding protein [Oscillatoriales cyanobacterium RM2_1_1]
MALIQGTPGNDFRVGTPFPDQIFGLQGNDSLDGTNANDVISGNTENDFVFGNAGPDILYGGQGNDNVDGGDGVDTLFGDTGADTVRGGRGQDLISGGSGSDLFILGGGVSNADTALDFNQVEGDTFAIEQLSAMGESSFDSGFLSTSSSDDIPYFLKLKQVGEDLLVGDSYSEDYMANLLGLGDLINDPLQLLSSMQIIPARSADYLEVEIDSQVSDPLTNFESYDPSQMLLDAEANLIQEIENLKAKGGDLLLLEGLEAALDELQGHTNGDVFEQAQPIDELFIYDSQLPGKTVFLVEQGTFIAPEFQAQMAGSEIFFVADGFFSSFAPEGLL